jgi:LysR family glycine cleavage system transcriptional activator
MWLRAAGVDGIDVDRGPRFSMEIMAVQAAIEGQGVVLTSGALVADDIAAGRLVRPFPDTVAEATTFSYYVVYPEPYLKRPKVVAFRDWVMAEAGKAPLP